MRKNLISLAAAMALASLACQGAAQALPGTPPPGGVVIPQAVLQACAADGGCILISANALQKRELAAVLEALLQQPKAEQGCSRASPGRSV